MQSSCTNLLQAIDAYVNQLKSELFLELMCARVFCLFVCFIVVVRYIARGTRTICLMFAMRMHVQGNEGTETNLNADNGTTL